MRLTVYISGFLMRQRDKKIRKKRTQKVAGELAAKKEGLREPDVHVKECAEVKAESGFGSIIGRVYFRRIGKIEICTGLLDCVASGKISEGSLRAVIAHEIGHIQRGDPLKMLRWRVECGLSTRLWWHPFQTARECLHECEYAADDWAVRLTDSETVKASLREMAAARPVSPPSWCDQEHPSTEARIDAVRAYAGL